MLAPCDLSALTPSSTVSHDGPNAVFGESTDSCSDGNAAISGTAASTVWTCGSEGALVCDLTFPYHTCRGSSIVVTGMFFLRGRLPCRFKRYLNCDSSSDTPVDWEGEVPSCRVVTGDVIVF